MYQNKITMIIFLIFWIFVLRMFFLEEERSTVHFLLGSTIFVVLLVRYKTLAKGKRNLQANITLFVSAVVLIALFFWYIQPLFS